ncbi:MAG TPA: PIN domain-containing protein [Candidatus Eremiobacteraeota bacterium]|nr:MAG: tRNA(fMet)-specific endonuclease VapC [bacterium ADurb.Bin363]HPZ08272.1 PIN domain-containing protein [Candidatus Eremiobacteraeota bacterium]
MKDKIFLDTNILIYATVKDRYRKNISLRLIKKNPVISTQVLNELSNVMSKKLKMNSQNIIKLIDFLEKKCEIKTIGISTIKLALNICDKYNYSYYDSLIIGSAIENNCNVLYTEDMQAGQKIDDFLEIINPF